MYESYSQQVISQSDVCVVYFFFSSRRRHTRCSRDWSSDVCSSDLCQRHLLYRAEPYELGVRLEWHPARNRLVVTGQLLNSSQPEIFRRDDALNRKKIGRASCRERV